MKTTHKKTKQTKKKLPTRFQPHQTLLT